MKKFYKIFLTLTIPLMVFSLPTMGQSDSICFSVQFDTTAGQIAVNNTTATTEAGEPTGSCFNGLDNTLWYWFVVTAGNNYTVTTDLLPLGTNVDTEIAAYTSSSGCGGVFTEIGCVQDNGVNSPFLETLILNASILTPGDTIWVQIDGWGATVGTFNLDIFATPPPPPPAPTTLYDFETEAGGSTGIFVNGWVGSPTSNFSWRAQAGPTGSTATGPDVDHTLGTASGIYMYAESSSPAALGDTATLISPYIQIDTFTTPTLSFWYHLYGADMGDLITSIYNGTTWVPVDTISGEVQTAGSDPWLKKEVSLAAFTADSVRIKFLGICGVGFNGDMSIDDAGILNSSPPPGPANDNVCNAIELSMGGTASFDNTSGTVEASETIGSCWTDGGSGTLENTVWFYFVAPSDGTYFVSTNYPPTPNDDTQIAAYLAGNGCGDFAGFTEIGCNDDVTGTNFLSEMTTTAVLAGDTVYVQVDGWAGTVGQFSIHVSLTQVVANFSFSANGLIIDFTDASTGSPDTWAWDFDDGQNSAIQNPQNTYAISGSYDVQLIASNAGSADTVVQTLAISGLNNALNQNVNVFPNPANNSINIQVDGMEIRGYAILDVLGREIISSDRVIVGSDVIDVSGIEPGNYLLKMIVGEEFALQRISIQR